VRVLFRSHPHLKVVREFQSEVEAIREAPYPLSTRIAVPAIGIMVAVVVAILFLTRMDRVVSSNFAQIVPSGQVNVYQALDTSIIRSLDVKIGQFVKAGTLMATLDPTITSADVLRLKQETNSYKAQIGRDEAQLHSKPLVYEDMSDPDFRKDAELQRTLYDQNMAQYRAQIDMYDAKIRETEATIKKYDVDAKQYKDRVGIASRIENMRTVLADSGYGSQLNMWMQQDQRTELEREVEYDVNSVKQSQETLASLKAQREAYIQQWLASLTQELVTAQASLDSAATQLDKAHLHHDLVRINAIEDTLILTVATLSVGSVLKPGDAIFTSMPANTRIEAEAEIATMYVGFVRVGDKCTLKIDTYDWVEHGTAEGKVNWISEGTYTTGADGKSLVPPYFKVRCSVDAYHFHDVPPNTRLIPGMTLETDLLVGTRSVAMYLLAGVIRGYSESMREP
jgi:hemolysin D